MKLFSILISIFIFSPTVWANKPESLSLFYQTAAEIEQAGSFDCEQSALAEKLRASLSLCGQPIKVWKSFAKSLIEVPNQSLMSELATVVYRNTLITEAYAQLYLYSRPRLPACRDSALPWVGGASLGSLKSGQVMRSGLSSSVVGGIPEFDRVKDANYLERFEDTVGPFFLEDTIQSATLTLGTGNRAIFEDLYWQLLAGASCGPREVIDTIKREKSWQKDKKLASSMKSWRKLAEAEKNCEPAAVTEANLNFVYVEQYLVGQPAMYEGFARSMGGWVLSPMVEAALPRALGKFPKFWNHAGRTHNNWEISFADVVQRVAWMQDQLKVMETSFRDGRDLLKPLYCAVAADSEQTRAIISKYAHPRRLRNF